MQVFNSRPLDKRSDVESHVYDVLDELNVEYQRVDHIQAMTMDACEDIEAALETRMFKNLFLVNSNKSQYYLLCMPKDKAFKTKDVSSQINSSRLSFGSHDKMEEYLSCTPGSASVLGLLFDQENKVKLLIDEELLLDETFGAHPCKNTTSLKIKSKDLYQKILPYCKHDYQSVKLMRYE